MRKKWLEVGNRIINIDLVKQIVIGEDYIGFCFDWGSRFKFDGTSKYMDGDWNVVFTVWKTDKDLITTTGKDSMYLSTADFELVKDALMQLNEG